MRDALDALPPVYADRLSNLDFVVMRHPSGTQRRRAQLRGGSLYGLYEGVPLPERGGWYGNVAPDKITIFWGPLVRDFPDEETLAEQVRKTVYHEIAHHFGISDLDLGGTSVY
jgi:predicted Zn-dependent protease with MMP-like domain